MSKKVNTSSKKAIQGGEVGGHKTNKRPQKKLPNGLSNGFDKSSYKGYEKWGNKRWAWEFLRRNSSFRKQCFDLASLDKKASTAMEKKIAGEFGIKRFKHCDEIFKSSTVKAPAFNPITFWHARDLSSRKLTLSLGQDHCLVRFDFGLLSKDAETLDGQWKAAKRLIEKRAKGLGKEAVQKNEIGHNNDARLTYLRLLDARLNTKESGSDIFLKICSREAASGEKIDREDLRQKFKSRYETAMKFAESGYLTFALGRVKKR